MGKLTAIPEQWQHFVRDGKESWFGDRNGKAPAAMIVGDSDVDILAGVNAGVWTCEVTYGFGSFEADSNPSDLVIHSLPELAAALDGAKSEPRCNIPARRGPQGSAS